MVFLWKRDWIFVNICLKISVFCQNWGLSFWLIQYVIKDMLMSKSIKAACYFMISQLNLFQCLEFAEFLLSFPFLVFLIKQVLHIHYLTFEQLLFTLTLDNCFWNSSYVYFSKQHESHLFLFLTHKMQLFEVIEKRNGSTGWLTALWSALY